MPEKELSALENIIAFAKENKGNLAVDFVGISSIAAAGIVGYLKGGMDTALFGAGLTTITYAVIREFVYGALANNYLDLDDIHSSIAPDYDFSMFCSKGLYR